MRKWVVGGLMVVLLAAVLLAPGLLAREPGAPGWFPSLASLIVWRQRTPPLVAGPKEPPVPTVTVDGVQVPAVRGSYCWASGDSSLCADSIAPPDLVARFGATLTGVKPGAVVRVAFPVAPDAGSLGATLWRESGPVDLAVDSEGGFRVETAPGRHVYAVHARWPQGDASYAFAVEVSR